MGGGAAERSRALVQHRARYPTLHRIAQHAPEGGVVERGRALVQHALPGRVQGQAKLLHAGSARQGAAVLTGARAAQPPGQTWLMLAWSGRGMGGTRCPLCMLGWDLYAQRPGARRALGAGAEPRGSVKAPCAVLRVHACKKTSAAAYAEQQPGRG